MVVSLLRSNPPDLLAFRNKTATITLIVGCMRPAEGAAALTCDLVFNSDYDAGLRQYFKLGCFTLHTLTRIRNAKATRCASALPPTLDWISTTS